VEGSRIVKLNLSTKESAMLRPVKCLLLIAVVTLIPSFAQADWPRFHGPDGTGVYTGEKLPPTEWSPENNVLWKAELPGPGVSSPIVVGDRVFVTCWSGYGLDEDNPGDINDLKRHLVCLHRKSGYKIWDKTVDAVQPEDPYRRPGVTTHGYASHTPVSDGERVYVFFGKTGALAFDFDGNQLWHKELGKESDPMRWGSSSSPILYKNVLIVTASAESQALVGLDTKTGEELWRAEGAGLDNTWSTPVVAKIGDDQAELVVGVPGEMWGLDPVSGKFHWYAEVPIGDQSNSSVFTKDGIVYTVQGSRGGGGSVAVKPGGKGEVTDSAVVWTGRPFGRFGTPVLYEGRIYNVSARSALCLNAENGERIYEAEIPAADQPATTNDDADSNQEEERPGRFRRGGRGRFGGSDYTSPVVAGGKIYFVTGSGETLVIKTGEKFELLARNKVTEDRENFMASPAISDGAIFLRSDKHLYCIAEQPAEETEKESESGE
jgi:hypothetical protein